MHFKQFLHDHWIKFRHWLIRLLAGNDCIVINADLSSPSATLKIAHSQKALVINVKMRSNKTPVLFK